MFHTSTHLLTICKHPTIHLNVASIHHVPTRPFLIPHIPQIIDHKPRTHRQTYPNTTPSTHPSPPQTNINHLEHIHKKNTFTQTYPHTHSSIHSLITALQSVIHISETSHFSIHLQHFQYSMCPFSRDEDVTVPPNIRNLGFLNYMTPFHKEVCIDTVITTKNQTFSCHAYIEEVSTSDFQKLFKLVIQKQKSSTQLITELKN